MANSLFADLRATAVESEMLAALVVVVVAYIVRGFAGFGAGLIYMPVAAALFDPKVAAATILIFDLPATVPFTIHVLPHAKVREVVPLVIGAAITTPLGAYLLISLDPVPLRWGLSILILAVLILVASGWRYRRPVNAIGATAVGCASGLFTGLAQIGAPPLILFWLSRSTAAPQMRAEASLFFTMTTVISIASYWVFGLFTYEVFLRSVLMAPVSAIGLLLGNHLYGFASQVLYRRVAYALVALAGVGGLPLLDSPVR